MNKVRNYLATMWRPACVALLGAIALGSLLMFSLDTLLPGATAQENASRLSATTFRDILYNPSFAPYKLVQLGVRLLRPDSLFLYRLISGVFASFTIVIFYLLIKRWFSHYVAMLSTLMFFTSSWFLGAARIGTPAIVLTALITLIYLGMHVRNSQKAIPWILATIAVCLALYIPGFVWFVVIGVAWQFKRLRKAFERLKSSTIILCSAIFVLMCIPMIVANMHSTDFLFTILGIPQNFRDPLDIVRHIAYVPVSIFWRAAPNPAYWLDGQPLLDIFSTALFILGTYSFARHWKLDRSWQLVGVFIFGSIWVGVSGVRENIYILLPFIYIVIAAGINWMLEEWFSVFPRNPIARAVGSSLVAIAIVITCNYHITKYFLAWPSTPATQSAYNEKI